MTAELEYRSYEEDSLDIDPSSIFFTDHVSRYWWAAELAREKTILDCGCGKGYGTFIMSRLAKKALGIDLNEGSLALANKLFQDQKVSYESRNVIDTESIEEKFDVVASFEVIEHIYPEQTDGFLAGMKRCLAPSGVVLISTPNHDVVLKSGAYVPEFHINNFRAAELKQKLKEHFSQVEMIGQFRKRSGLNQLLFDWDFFNARHLAKGFIKPPSSSPVDDQHGERASENTTQLENPKEFFATKPDFCQDYQFSPWHWRQAGLSVAICKP